MRACTTLAATSENLIAVTWIDWIRSWRYSEAYETGLVEVKRTRTKSNLFKIGFLCSLKLLLEEQHDFFHISARRHAQGDAYSLASDLYVSTEEKGDKLDRKSAYGRQSADLDRTCSRSMISPSMTGPCLERRFSIRSRTISFTLLSDSLTTRLIRQEAAAAGNGISQIQSHSETLNTFDCSGILCQRCQSCCGFIFNRMRWHSQQFQDATNPACLR